MINRNMQPRRPWRQSGDLPRWMTLYPNRSSHYDWRVRPLSSLRPVCAADISRVRARPKDLPTIPARSNSHPENLFLPSTQGSEAANEQTKTSFVMCGAAAVGASLTRSRAIQPWFSVSLCPCPTFLKGPSFAVCRDSRMQLQG